MNNMQLRCICTCATLQASYSQLGRIVNKVMSSEHTKKARQKESCGGRPAIVPNPVIPFGQSGTKKVTTHKNRRVTVLNKLFMKYITDLMSTGEVAPKLLGKGIEISHVKVSPDFKVVNCYWFAQNEENANESTEQILRLAAGQLQHELSQLRVIGLVPPIQFIKNKHYLVTKEVENRLAEVDFGEDYVPTAYIARRDIPILQTSIPPELKAKISELDQQNTENEECYEIKVPEMRQDVLGVNHAAIMARVKHSLNKIKTIEKSRILNISEESQPTLSAADISNLFSSREESKMFDDFLKKRLVEEKRKLKALPLRETKLQEEREWMESMNDYNDVEDLQIEEEYRDEYKDIEKH